MQSNFKLLSAILGPLLIYGDYADKQLPVLEAFLQSGQAPEEGVIKASIPEFVMQGVSLLNPEVTSFTDALPGTVALIPVTGPLMRNDSCFSAGMATMGQWVDEAAANPNIIAIVQYANGPGGTTDYTDVLASKFNAARLVKPVVTFTDGLMASATAWIGSSSDYIFVGSKNAIIGSIGTKFEFKTRTDAAETTHVITSEGSEDKVRSIEEAKKGKYQLIRSELLNPLNENFKAAMQSNRPGISEEALGGKVFIGEAAIPVGLADAFGTLEDAVQKALELANSRSTSAKNNSINNSNDNMKKFTIKAAWAGILAFAGLTVPEGSTSVEGEFSEEKLAELNAKLEEVDALTQAKADLEAKEATLQAALTAAGVENIEALVASRNDWKTKAETFGAQPGTTPTQPVKTGTDTIDTPAPKAELTEWEKEAQQIHDLCNPK